jgi:hypothetical protein
VTIIGLASLLMRRWYVVIGSALVCSIVAANLLVAPPVYAVRGSVLMVAPDQAVEPVPRWDQGSDLSPFAAAVERRANDGRPVLRLNSPDATLAGVGIREGVRVQVPNYGGQWAISFQVPEVVIEVVSRDPQGLEERYAAEVARVQAIASDLQQEAGVPESERIRAVPRTLEPQVTYVGPTGHGRMRALAAAVLISILLTLAVTFEWDRVASRRRGRKAAGSSTSSDDSAVRPTPSSTR